MARKNSAVVDRYYFAPNGKKFRSVVEINTYLNPDTNNKEGAGKDGESKDFNL